MSTPPALSEAELARRLEDLARSILRYRHAEGHYAVPASMLESLSATVEGLALARGEVFEPVLPAKPVGDRNDNIFSRVRDAMSVDELTALLQGVEPEVVMVLLSDTAPTKLVMPEHFRAASPTGPTYWGFYTPVRGYPVETCAYLDGLLLDILADPTHPRVVEILLASVRFFDPMTMEPEGPMAERLLAYAEGRVPGAMLTHQRLAARSVLRAPWATPPALRVLVGSAGDGDIEVAQAALSHPRADITVWRAAVESPHIERFIDTLTLQPAACRDAAIWPVLFKALETHRSKESAEQMARLLRHSTPESMDTVLTWMIARRPERAFEIVSRMAKSRLHAINPDTLVPLMSSSLRHVREGMVTLMASVGPDAVPVTKPRRSR